MRKKGSKPRTVSARSAKAGKPPLSPTVSSRVKRRQKTAIATVRKGATAYQSPDGARPAPTKLPRRMGPKR